MIEWETTETPPTSQDEAPEGRSPHTRPSWRRWLPLLILLLMAGAIAGGWTWWRYREAEVLLQRDLLTFIRSEERARRLGLQEQVPQLLAQTGIEAIWQERYTARFRTPEGAAGVEVTLEQVEVDGANATVWVRTGQQVQRRAYRLTEQGWRRVPLEVGWAGQVQSRETESLHLSFHMHDEAFAEQLMADLPTLAAQIEAWRFVPPVLNRVVIKSDELQSGVISDTIDQAGEIYLTSPDVVMIPTHWDMSGAGAVRYELASRVWSNLGAATLQPNSDELPNAVRFITAIKIVQALRWALPSQEYETVVARWHNARKELQWESPFFPLQQFGDGDDPFSDSPSVVAMYLVADEWVRQTEEETHNRLPELLRTATTWDGFFIETLGKPLREVEASINNSPVAALPSFPLTIAPRSSNADMVSPYGIGVTVEGYAQPITVNHDETAQLVLSDGSTLAPECAALFSDIQVEGTWHDEGLSVNATRFIVGAATPPSAAFTIAEPPTDTFAYVATINRPDGAAVTGYTDIAAIRADGALVPILSTPITQTLQQYQSFGASALTFTVNISRYNCQAQWLLRYETGRGVTGEWLVTTEAQILTPQLFWDAQSKRGVIVTREGAYWRVEEGVHILTTPSGMITGGELVGVRPGTTQLVVRTLGSEFLLIDEQGDRQRFAPMGLTEDSFVTSFFSKDGREFYVSLSSNTTDASTGSYLIAFNADDSSQIPRMVWQSDLNYFNALFSDLTDDTIYGGLFAPQGAEFGNFSLAKVKDGQITLLFDGSSQTQLTALGQCTGGGLFYVTQVGAEPSATDTTYTLHRIAPDGSERSIPLAPDLYPLGCP